MGIVQETPKNRTVYCFPTGKCYAIHHTAHPTYLVAAPETVTYHVGRIATDLPAYDPEPTCIPSVGL